MTSNQIAFWNLQENQRHNQQSELIESDKVAATRRGQDITKETADKDRALKEELGKAELTEKGKKRRQDLGLGIGNMVTNLFTGAAKAGATAAKLFI